MKRIALGGREGKGKYALVDDRDFDALNQYHWRFSNRYVVRTVWLKDKRRCRPVGMHTQITGYNLTDHKNGNTLDNRRSNLRPATPSQNAQNRAKIASASSRYKGVTLHRQSGKWQLVVNGVYRGLYETEAEAATKYDEIATVEFGRFARLNGAPL